MFTRRGFIGALAGGLAGGLLALRLNLGGGQGSLEVKHGAISVGVWDAWWKKMYPPEMVQTLAYSSGHPLLSRLRKDGPGVYVAPVTRT